jgi:hypothetical protein
MTQRRSPDGHNENTRLVREGEFIELKAGFIKSRDPWHSSKQS